MHWLLVWFFSLSALAGWEVPPPASYLELNPILFTNRAECARESRRPSKSIFLVADTLDIGKALFRLAEIRGLPESFSADGVRRYRYALYGLSQIIITRLLQGELPLLDSKNADYQNVIKTCQDDCPMLDDYVARLWEEGDRHAPRLKQQTDSKVSCYSVEDFSSLFPHLAAKKPSRDDLNNMAQAVHQHPKLVKTCGDALSGDLSVGMYQLDLLNIDDEEWELKGFSLWQSFNVYLSWAFRHAPQMRQLSLEYYPIFRQANIEELTIFFSNGCRSLTRPECGKDYLNINSLRELAQIDQAQDLAKLELFSFLPENDNRELITNGDFEVNNDRLAFGAHMNATEWAKNFKDNLAKTRGYIRLKLSQSLANLKLLRNGIGNQLTNEFLNYTKADLDLNRRQELYLACAEFKIALDRDFSFLRANLEKMSQNEQLWNYAASIHQEVVTDLAWFHEQFTPAVLSACSKLDDEHWWQSSDRPENPLFSPWYQQYVFKKVARPEAQLEFSGSPFFAINNGQSRKLETICATPAGCARRLLDAIMDLKIASDFASGLLALTDQLKTPNLTNPLAEKVACRAYDPWGQTKKAAFDFVQDMVLAGLSAAVITPIYLDANFTTRNVTSLEELIRDGSVYYNPRFDRGAIQRSLIIDFGPLLGTPCAIGISRDTRMRPPNYLAFEGITLQSCRDNSRTTINAFSADEIETTTRNFSGCFTCTISLTSVATSATSFNPLTRPFFYVVRGVFRLVNNLRSFDDIPKSWLVDYNSVYRSWRRHNGKIPKSCERPLRRGEECLMNKCEEKIVSTFEKAYGQYVSSLKVILGGDSIITTPHKTYVLKTNRYACFAQKIRPQDFREVPQTGDLL